MNELNNREQEQYAEPTTKKSSKQIVKRTLVVIGLALAVYVVYSVIYLFISPDRNIQQIYLVPENAAFIIQSSAPIEDWEKFSGSETWQCLKKAKSFEEVTKSVEKLDSVVKSNKVLLSLVGKRDMLISLHKTRATDWDFLLILDMQKASKMDLVKDQLETVLVMSGFTVTNRMHSGINILEMRDPDTRDIFYIAFVDNHLVGSYTSGLIESAIDSRNKPKIGLDQAFIETEKLVSGKGLVRVFINYERIPQFMSIYLGTRNEYIDMFSNSMNFAGLYLNMGKDKMEVKGYTLKKDSVDPYITALLNSGKHKMKAHEILSGRTALYTNIGFDSPVTFVKELENALSVHDKLLYDSYQSSRKKIESLFGISLEENFLSWMSGEFAITQSEPGLLGHDPEVILAIRAKSIKDARKNMEFIEKKIIAPVDIIIKPVRIVPRASTERFAVSDRHIEQLLQYIDNNYQNPLSVDELTQIIPFSRRVLEKKFKRETGTSVYQYLLDLRIEKFADLLITTDLPLIEAATRSGFTDYKNISRIFTKAKEMTPLQYRKRFTPKNK